MAAGTLEPSVQPAVVQSGHPGIARLLAGYGAIACAVPYLALKIIWLAGGQLGVADADMMRDRSMVALNAITAGMDLVAIVIALAFTHRWGLRIAAWLVLPPMWVATGLLLRFVAGVPAFLIVQALRPAPARALPVRGPVEPWVYAVVYTEFAGMGIGLMLAFLFYARRRWPELFRSAAPVIQLGPTHVVQVPLAHAGALIAMAVAGLHLAWLLGATVGLGEELLARRSFSSRVISNGIDAALAIAAAAGVLMLVHRRLGQRTRAWIPLTLTWIGSGSLFAWGLWHLINVLGNTALVRDQAGGMAVVNLVSLARLLSGLVIGLVMLVALAERRASPAAS